MVFKGYTIMHVSLLSQTYSCYSATPWTIKCHQGAGVGEKRGTVKLVNERQIIYCPMS